MTRSEVAAAALLAASLFALPITVARGEGRCELGITLVMDLSGSITTPERALVLGGTANALRHPAVVEAFSGQNAMVSVIAFGDKSQVVVPWVPVTGADSLYDVALAVEGSTPSVGQGTDLSLAVGGARAAMEAIDCDREVADILTDAQNGGAANVGDLRQEMAHLDPFATTINVLQVADRANIDVRADLRFGFAGFVMRIGSLAEVEKAMISKLILEVS